MGETDGRAMTPCSGSTRRQQEGRWAGPQLNNSLYAVTFLAQQNHKGKTCLHCLETDHVAHELRWLRAQWQPINPCLVGSLGPGRGACVPAEGVDALAMLNLPPASESATRGIMATPIPQLLPVQA